MGTRHLDILSRAFVREARMRTRASVERNNTKLGEELQREISWEMIWNNAKRDCKFISWHSLSSAREKTRVWTEVADRGFAVKDLFPDFEARQGFKMDTKLNYYPGYMHKSMVEMVKWYKKAHLIVEMRDARLPFTTSKKSLISYLEKETKCQKPRILVFNKADLISVTDKRYLLSLFPSPSDKSIFLTSAYHHQGCIQIKKHILSSLSGYTPLSSLSSSSPSLSPSPSPSPSFSSPLLSSSLPASIPRDFYCLLLGTPNVGKSSLINAFQHLNRESFYHSKYNNENVDLLRNKRATVSVHTQRSHIFNSYQIHKGNISLRSLEVGKGEEWRGEERRGEEWRGEERREERGEEREEEWRGEEKGGKRKVNIHVIESPGVIESQNHFVTSNDKEKTSQYWNRYYLYLSSVLSIDFNFLMDKNMIYYISDFLLFTLNSRGLFHYVNEFELTEPTNDVMLLGSHIAQMLRLKKSDQYYDVPSALLFFLKLYNNGQLGHFILDETIPVAEYIAHKSVSTAPVDPPNPWNDREYPINFHS